MLDCEDAGGLAFISHPGDDLGCEHEAGVEPACLLDPRGHSGALCERGELVDDQHRELAAGLAAGEVVREVLEQEPRESAGLLPQRDPRRP